jgi:hypothetical protein
MKLNKIHIDTENNLKLQDQLYQQILNELTQVNTEQKIIWQDTELLCLRTKQGVIKIKEWEEKFQKYACWKFTKKKEFHFDKYE